MRFIPYLRYFFYIAWHWNPLLAIYTIYYEFRGEKKYQIHTIGEDELNMLKERGIDISHAHIYMPVNYFILERLMNEMVQLEQNKTLLDMGCGKGRVLVVAAAYGFKKITGIDISKEFCQEALATTAALAGKYPDARFMIINVDARYFDIPDDICSIFLFNPFDDLIMHAVAANINKSQQANPRIIRILYANPLYKSVFLDQGFTEIFHVRKHDYFEGSILERKRPLPAVHP